MCQLFKSTVLYHIYSKYSVFAVVWLRNFRLTDVGWMSNCDFWLQLPIKFKELSLFFRPNTQFWLEGWPLLFSKLIMTNSYYVIKEMFLSPHHKKGRVCWSLAPARCPAMTPSASLSPLCTFYITWIFLSALDKQRSHICKRFRACVAVKEGSTTGGLSAG